MDTSPHKSDFVNVNGINLHYLDWGGEGEILLFLTGMDTSAHIYDRIAPRFTDKFHVLALTRRGQGESDYPETGYDITTLTDDIRQFMDFLQIKKVILAGHSMAGVELTHFAGTYPDRVLKLIYLDAHDDYRGILEMERKNPLSNVGPPETEKEPTTVEEFISSFKLRYPSFTDIWSELWDLEISYEVTTNEKGIIVGKMSDAIAGMMFETLGKYIPIDIPANIPILRFFAEGFSRPPYYYSDEQKAMAYQYHHEVRLPVLKSGVVEFQSRCTQAKIVEIPEGHHYCFVAQEELVYEEMRKFLLD